jgi:hypothetical protein
MCLISVVRSSIRVIELVWLLDHHWHFLKQESACKDDEEVPFLFLTSPSYSTRGNFTDVTSASSYNFCAGCCVGCQRKKRLAEELTFEDFFYVATGSLPPMTLLGHCTFVSLSPTDLILTLRSCSNSSVENIVLVIEYCVGD